MSCVTLVIMRGLRKLLFINYLVGSLHVRNASYLSKISHLQGIYYVMIFGMCAVLCLPAADVYDIL